MRSFIYHIGGSLKLKMLQDKLADIEGAEVCWCTSTGMAAVFTIFMSFLKKGDRVVAGRALFGSCHHIITEILPKFGIEVELVDGKDLNAWDKALKKKNFTYFF